MIKVIFQHLLRSKYGIKEISVNAGKINEILDQIIEIHPEINRKDFSTAIVFYKGSPIHSQNFDKRVNDDESIIITHFVGGG